MNTNNLNDLFSVARTEQMPDVVNERDAERLVIGHVMRPVPQVTLMQRLFQPLRSTPLRLATTTMTIAALTAIGILAVKSLVLPPAPQVQIVQPATPHIPAIAAIIVHDSIPNRSANPAPPQTESASNELPALPALPPIPPIPPLPPIPPVTPIELTEAQLSQLGIELKDDGEIESYSQSSTSEISCVGFPADHGINLHIGEKFSKNELSGIHIPHVAPRMITATSGAKLMFSFTQFNFDTTYPGSNGKSIHISQDVKIYNDMDTTPNRNLNASLNRILRTDSNLHVMKIFGSNPGSMQINFDSSVPSKSIRYTLTPISKDRPNGNTKMDLGPNANARLDFNQDTNDVIKLEHAMKVIAQNDTVFSKVMVINRDSRDSVISKDQEEEAHVFFHNIAHELAMKDLHQSDSTIFTQCVNLDRLIPILVRNTKDPEHPNTLIFWYEPTPEITQMLPANKVASYSQQSEPNFTVSVFPNPTSGPATLSFKLKNASQHATFTLRDLLGKAVLEAGTSSGESGSLPLDLSQLPAGLYLLVTTTDDGQQRIERVVVNK